MPKDNTHCLPIRLPFLFYFSQLFSDKHYIRCHVAAESFSARAIFLCALRIRNPYFLCLFQGRNRFWCHKPIFLLTQMEAARCKPQCGCCYLKSACRVGRDSNSVHAEVKETYLVPLDSSQKALENKNNGWRRGRGGEGRRQRLPPHGWGLLSVFEMAPGFEVRLLVRSRAVWVFLHLSHFDCMASQRKEAGRPVSWQSRREAPQADFWSSSSHYTPGKGSPQRYFVHE